MLKKIKTLSDLLNIENQKKDFDGDVSCILKIIKEESGLDLKNKNIFIKNNNLKIIVSSNIKFIILMHLEKISKKIKSLNKGFILEL